jgi:hypothetical protein
LNLQLFKQYPGPEIFLVVIRKQKEFITSHIINYITNTVGDEPKGSTVQTPKAISWHKPEPVPSTPYQHNLLPYDLS